MKNHFSKIPLHFLTHNIVLWVEAVERLLWSEAMRRGIFLAVMVCVFLGFGEFALAKESNPHFFGKIVKPVVVSSTDDFLGLFEKIEKSAKHFFVKKLNPFIIFDDVKRIHIKFEIDFVFKDENK